jgi:hypothetical protein
LSNTDYAVANGTRATGTSIGVITAGFTTAWNTAGDVATLRTSGYMTSATQTPVMIMTLSQSATGTENGTNRKIAGLVGGAISLVGSVGASSVTDGCYLVASSTVANWWFTCADGNVTNAGVDTGVASTSQGSKFAIEINTTARASCWKFNGDAWASCGVVVANVPSDNLLPILRVTVVAAVQPAANPALGFGEIELWNKKRGY